jgi:tRNA threonylcarbamoyladenosine biosynthesis protein TsaE
MYRIVSEDDLYSTGFYDYLDGKGVVFMEWSENVPFAVDADAIRLTISKGEGDERFFRVESPRKLF